jgi:hypothetical protein
LCEALAFDPDTGSAGQHCTEESQPSHYYRTEEDVRDAGVESELPRPNSELSDPFYYILDQTDFILN